MYIVSLRFYCSSSVFSITPPNITTIPNTEAGGFKIKTKFYWGYLTRSTHEYYVEVKMMNTKIQEIRQESIPGAGEVLQRAGNLRLPGELDTEMSNPDIPATSL